MSVFYFTMEKVKKKSFIGYVGDNSTNIPNLNKCYKNWLVWGNYSQNLNFDFLSCSCGVPGEKT